MSERDYWSYRLWASLVHIEAIKVSFFGAILASFRGPRAARHICSRDILLLTGGGRRLRADSGSVVLENAGACLTSCHLARLSPPLMSRLRGIHPNLGTRGGVGRKHRKFGFIQMRSPL